MKTLIIPISVGSIYHEYLDFHKLKQYIHTHSFKVVHFIIADTLQHYTKMGLNETLDKVDAINISTMEGIKWLHKHKHTIDNIFFECGVYTTIRFWCEVNTDLKQLPEMIEPFVSNMAEMVCKRMSKKHPSMNQTHFIHYSKKYIREELMVLKKWCDEYDEFVLYYPKDIGIAFKKMNTFCLQHKITFIRSFY
jgi:hypothetical protein